MLTLVLEFRLLVVIVTSCLSARGWSSLILDEIAVFRLVLQSRPGTFLDSLASLSSWDTICLRSFRPSLKPVVLGYLAMSLATPSRSSRSSFSLLEASVMNLV